VGKREGDVVGTPLGEVVGLAVGPEIVGEVEGNADGVLVVGVAVGAAEMGTHPVPPIFGSYEPEHPMILTVTEMGAGCMYTCQLHVVPAGVLAEALGEVVHAEREHELSISRFHVAVKLGSLESTTQRSGMDRALPSHEGSM
jgi:hypothetical protein